MTSIGFNNNNNNNNIGSCNQKPDLNTTSVTKFSKLQAASTIKSNENEESNELEVKNKKKNSSMFTKSYTQIGQKSSRFFSNSSFKKPSKITKSSNNSVTTTPTHVNNLKSKANDIKDSSLNIDYKDAKSLNINKNVTVPSLINSDDDNNTNNNNNENKLNLLNSSNLNKNKRLISHSVSEDVSNLKVMPNTSLAVAAQSESHIIKSNMILNKNQKALGLSSPPAPTSKLQLLAKNRQTTLNAKKELSSNSTTSAATAVTIFSKKEINSKTSLRPLLGPALSINNSQFDKSKSSKSLTFFCFLFIL